MSSIFACIFQASHTLFSNGSSDSLDAATRISATPAGQFLRLLVACLDHPGQYPYDETVSDLALQAWMPLQERLTSLHDRLFSSILPSDDFVSNPASRLALQFIDDLHLSSLETILRKLFLCLFKCFFVAERSTCLFVSVCRPVYSISDSLPNTLFCSQAYLHDKLIDSLCMRRRPVCTSDKPETWIPTVPALSEEELERWVNYRAELANSLSGAFVLRLPFNNWSAKNTCNFLSPEVSPRESCTWPFRLTRQFIELLSFDDPLTNWQVGF
ncbi:unnamed protein product [Protopolystoma xenopodis]|uniref:Uncharacterized protein n=1 Tax=Protopolystoma xenopodis TaxID=117903 RepID=A0A3S5FBL0_9PLAT|nr:unnamed protein product [Protopolystoma xenopodis]